MADNLLQLIIRADTKDLDTAKEKISQLGEHLPTVGDLIRGFGQSFMSLPGPVGIAAAALTGLATGATELVKSAMEAVNSITELSHATGVGVGQLQVMKTAMSLTGASTQGLGEMLARLNQTMDQAQDPTSRASVAMRMLGVSQEELKKGNTAEVMQHLAQTLEHMAPSAQKTALEMAVFGRAGAQADEAIASLAKNTDEAKRILAEHGAISEQDVASQEKLNAAMVEAKAVFEGLGLTIMRAVVPSITEAVQWFDHATRINGPLVTGIRETWDVLKELGHAFMTLISPIVSLVEQMGATTMSMGKAAAGGALVSSALSGLKDVFSVFVDEVKAAVVVIYGAFESLMTLDEVVVRVGNALSDLAHGKLTAAGHAFDGFTASVEKNISAVKQFAHEQFSGNLDKVVEAVKKVNSAMAEGSSAGQTHAGSLSAAYKAMQAEVYVQQYNEKLKAQVQILHAAGTSLEAYRQAQSDVAEASQLASLRAHGATEAQLKLIKASMDAANAAKAATTDEVAGWNLILSLKQKDIALTKTQSELAMAQEKIAQSPGMTEAQKKEIVALAEKIDKEKEQAILQKEITGLDAIGAANAQKNVNLMRMSTNELRLYNQEMKLREQYLKDLTKEPQDVQKLTEAYAKNLQIIIQNNEQTQKLQQSFTGFTTGALQGLSNMLECAKNMNQFGLQMAKTLTDGLTNSFIKMAQGGKDAFGQLLASLGQMVAQQILHFAITEAEIAALSALGISPQESALLLGAPVTKSANGNVFQSGAVTAFASGGVVGGPTMVPMALMGEAGPEAVMPLSRDPSTGKLGVHMNGSGTSSSGQTVHIHAPQIVINSNQPAHEVAAEAKKQLKLADARMLNVIHRQSQPGGLLHKSSFFAA
jgi:lambda family phage tail tape measure protein